MSKFTEMEMIVLNILAETTSNMEVAIGTMKMDMLI